MSEEKQADTEGAPGGPEDGGEAEGAATDDDAPRAEKGRSKGSARGGRMGDGIRQGIGVLSAFKEALEETIQEARERGDLSAERAKEVVKEALDKAQTAAEEARERLDFVPRSEFEELQAALAALNDRVTTLETAVSGGGDGAADSEDETG